MTELDRWSEVPPYLQIAAILRARIESGKLQAHRAIPSVNRIMGEFSVARTTAVKAVKVLKDEGLVRTIPGMGSYVVRPHERPRHPPERG